MCTYGTETIDRFTKIGSYDSRNDKYSPSSPPQPVEFEPNMRDVKTLQQLGYTVEPDEIANNPLFETWMGQEILIYTIRHPDRPGDNGIIARLGACPGMGLLYD